MINTFIDTVKKGTSLSEEEAKQCLDTIFSQDIPTDDIAALLTALAKKGEAVSEIYGFALSMRESMIRLDLGSPLMDLCGTGGSGKDRFNVSTAAAFVVASAGIPVAKHGNYGSQKPNGSFDFLKALDVPFGQPIEEIQKHFKKSHVAFLLARQFHPAVAKVAEARKKVGTRTIFNMLGPLCNPASATHQIIATPEVHTAKKLAEVLLKLGTTRALVIAGHDYTDELSLYGPSHLFEVHNGAVTSSAFDPKTCCLTNPLPVLEGHAAANAVLFKELFSKGITTKAVSQMVCLNAGAAFYIFGAAESIAEGKMLAEDHVKTKLAWQKYRLCCEM
jgi:anthranilate phosphoribosyltransferase